MLQFLLYSTLSFSKKMGTSDALVLYRNRINCYPPCRGTVIFKSGHPSMIVECFHFLFHNCIFLDKQWLCATTYLFINIILPLNKIKKRCSCVCGINSCMSYLSNLLGYNLFRLVRHLLLKNLTPFFLYSLSFGHLFVFF